MKRTTYCIMAAALLTAGALLTTGCSSDDDAAIERNEAKTITFIATLTAKDGAMTRAITTGTEGGKKILNVAWTVGEQIAVYYQKTDDSYDKAIATVGEPNGDGSAPITATLSDAKNGGTVKFVYPAYLVNATGDDIDESKLLTKQRGILTHSGSGEDYSISKRFDAATGSGTLVTDGTTCGTSARITMENRVCICKFTFSLTNSGVSASITELEHVDIHIDGRTYSITPSNYATQQCLYVAMLPVSGSDALFGAYNRGMASGSVTIYADNYVKLASNVTLEAGKFYRNIPIQCVMATEYTGSRTTQIKPTQGAVILNNVSVVTGDGNAFDILDSDARETENFIIVLMGNNVIKSTNKGSAGIYGPNHMKSLTIGGNGSLTATAGPQTGSEQSGAAIGGMAGGGDVGVINIHGTIASLTANGGIGAQTGGYCRGIYIDGVGSPTAESTYPHLTRSGDTWTHK